MRRGEGRRWEEILGRVGVCGGERGRGRRKDEPKLAAKVAAATADGINLV